MLKNYPDCLDAIVLYCPGTANMKYNMAKAFYDHSINEVRSEIQLQTDGCTPKTLVMNTDEFLDFILFQRSNNRFPKTRKVKYCLVSF